MKQRENNYDLLRIISCIAVIFLHVSSTYKDGFTDESIFGEIITDNILGICLYSTLFRFAVPCFVMLAGAFALSNDKNSEFKVYYKKIFISIGIPTLIFSIVYIVLKLCEVLLVNNKTDALLEMVILILKGEPLYHMWYLYMMVILYILVPIIIQWKKQIAYNTFKWITIATVIVTTLSGWVSEFGVHWGIKSFAYLGYFLVGYLIKISVKKRNNLEAMIFIFFSIVIETCETVVVYYLAINGISGAEVKYSIAGPLNPMIAVASILLFIGFSKLEIKRDFSGFAEQTFLIYLIHAGVWAVLYRIVKKIDVSYSCLIIPILVIVVLCLSTVLGKLYKKIWQIIDGRLHISENLCAMLF